MTRRRSPQRRALAHLTQRAAMRIENEALRRELAEVREDYRILLGLCAFRRHHPDRITPTMPLHFVAVPKPRDPRGDRRARPARLGRRSR